MRLIGLAVALAVALTVSPLATDAQPALKGHRIGFIGTNSPGLESRMIGYFQDRLAELGYVNGGNIAITYHWADGNIARFPQIAEDLVRAQPDLIVTPCGPALHEVRKRHRTIALVIRSHDLKSCAPEIATLEHPGGHTTGAIVFSPEATARRFDVLKRLIPGLTHVALLHQPDSDWAAHWSHLEAAAREAALRLYRAAWRKREDLAAAFDDAMVQRVGAVLTLGDGPTWTHRHSIFEIAAERRLPVLYDFGMFPAAELGLMSYAIDTRAFFSHVAEQVDQILRGARPSDIPIGRPQKFRLFINHDAAKALGLKIPQSLLLQADRVLE
jgi:putative tryptophan/tyrosine transport system substrate-binding protein